MHFAAYSLVPESVKKPLKYYDNNVTGMISLLKAMNDANVKYLVFSSSAATYGIPKKLPITEDTPLNPINPYGETKMMMEKIMAWADKLMALSILLCVTSTLLVLQAMAQSVKTMLQRLT